ncbi:hypothetical protein ACDI16_02100 [Oceanobacillus caeni]
MAKNPLLEKKYQEGKWDGIQQSTSYFLDRFEELKKEPGIGPKTQEKIEAILFRRYEKN